MYTAEQVFGVGGADLAWENAGDPQTPAVPTYASTEATTAPPLGALRALTDPTHSAIFWIAAAAILGLVLISGQIRVQAMLGGRAGRR